MALTGALCCFVHAVAGFTNHSLRGLVAGLLGTDYSTTQMTYDLRRLRLHGLIERIPRTNTYVLTPDGVRVAVFYTKVHSRLLRPLIAAGRPTARTPRAPPRPRHHRPRHHHLHPRRQTQHQPHENSSQHSGAPPPRVLASAAMLSDHAVAADVATRAGELLLDLRAKAGSTAHDWWSLRDEGDWSAHRFIVEALGELRPDDKVLSEEGIEDRSRLGADRVWIVDPLDGTREFGEPGRADWAVHVALVDGHGEPIAGAVALPAMGLTLATDPPPPLPPAHDGPPRVVVSRSRPPAVALRIAEALGADLVALGSAGAKAMAVVLGEVDVYAHAGGQYEWDNCAPSRGRSRCGFACVAHRRPAARLQPVRPVAARPADLPSGTRGEPRSRPCERRPLRGERTASPPSP